MTTALGMTQAVGLSGMTSPVDTGLLQHVWSSDIELEAVQEEPFINSTAINERILGSSQKKLPEGMFVTVVADATERAARDMTLEFYKSLSGTGVTGTTSLISNEETPQLKYTKIYANDVKHGFAGQTFGINARELSRYKVYEKAKPLLGQWWGEKEGYYLREALIQTVSANAAASPVSATQRLTKNMYIVGATSQPSYDTTNATYSTNIGTLLTSTTYTNMTYTITRVIAQAETAINTNYLEPVMLNGKLLYALWMHPDEYRKMIDPSTSSGFSYYWTAASPAATGDLDKLLPGLVGIIADRVAVCLDRRAPTCTMSGNSTSGYTLTFGYMAPGRTDGRTTGTTANTHFNVNYFLGKRAAIKYVTEQPHYEDQYDEYQQYKNIGYFGSYAWNVPMWDVDTATSTSGQQEGCMVSYTQR